MTSTVSSLDNLEVKSVPVAAAVEEVKGLDDEVESDVVTIVHVPDANLTDDVLPGTRYYLTVKQTKNCGLFDSILRKDAESNSAECKISAEREIPVPTSYVTDYALERCIAYLKHHNGAVIKLPSGPLRSKDLTAIWPEWDVNFIDEVFQAAEKCAKLYDVILAANYLDLQGIIRLGCSKIAILIKGAPLDKINAILGIDMAKSARTAEQKSDEDDDMKED